MVFDSGYPYTVVIMKFSAPDQDIVIMSRDDLVLFDNVDDFAVE